MNHRPNEPTSAVSIRAGTRQRTAVRRIALARAVSFTGGAAAFMALNFEIYRLTRGESNLAIVALVLNLAVVAFMLYALWTRRRTRIEPPA